MMYTRLEIIKKTFRIFCNDMFCKVRSISLGINMFLLNPQVKEKSLGNYEYFQIIKVNI